MVVGDLQGMVVSNCFVVGFFGMGFGVRWLHGCFGFSSLRRVDII